MELFTAFLVLCIGILIAGVFLSGKFENSEEPQKTPPKQSSEFVYRREYPQDKRVLESIHKDIQRRMLQHHLSQSVTIPEIQNCTTIYDVIMSLNYGRVYPYFTGMNLTDVKKTVKLRHQDTSKFDKELGMYELMGRIPGVDLPNIANSILNRVYLGFNKDNLVSSITIDIKDFDKNKAELIEEMALKFGEPVSIDRQFIIWREQHMLANIDAENKCISVIDLRLSGF